MGCVGWWQGGMESRGATAPRLSEKRKYNSCGTHEEPGTCRQCLATADVPAPERTQTSGRLPNSSKALARNVACACDAGSRSRRDLVSMKNALAKPSTRPATSAECFVMRDDALPLPLWRPRGVGERRRDCFRSFAAAIAEETLLRRPGRSVLERRNSVRHGATGDCGKSGNQASSSSRAW